MNLPLKIARRYVFANSISGVLLVLIAGYVILPPLLVGLFLIIKMTPVIYLLLVLRAILLFFFLLFFLLSKLFKSFKIKSVNAINIISGVSVFGISLGTAALILVLSVFNGFEDLISGLFSTFNPDVKITALKGKTYTVDSSMIAQLEKIDGVIAVSQTIEEVAFFEYKGSRDFGTLKGVDENYEIVTRIDSTIREGELLFEANGRSYGVLGVGMRNKLSVNVDNEFTPVSVYMAKKKKSVTKPFIKKNLYPSGTFVIQQDFDNQYILSSLAFARNLLSVKNEVSALELKIDHDKEHAQTISKIREAMGKEYVVKDRYQQDEAFLKLMNLEKWLSYAILSLTLILVAFNMIGSLWMIVIDKKKDIAILKSMGATVQTIRNVFLNQGLLLCTVGMVFGFLIAIVLYLLQIYYGIVPIPQGFVVNAYPISMRFVDFTVVAITVLVIGLLASIIPALKAANISALVRED